MNRDATERKAIFVRKKIIPAQALQDFFSSQVVSEQ